MDRILIIMKKNNGHQGIICPFTGAFFHNMQTCLLVYTYNRSQVSVYRTIGPLVKIEPSHEKTNDLHMRKQRRRSAVQ